MVVSYQVLFKSCFLKNVKRQISSKWRGKYFYKVTKQVKWWSQESYSDKFQLYMIPKHHSTALSYAYYEIKSVLQNAVLNSEAGYFLNTQPHKTKGIDKLFLCLLSFI